MLKLFFTGFLCASLALPSFAGSAGQPGDFFTQAAGSRARGMGGAFTAVADDASAAWFNPAGLSLLAYKEFTAFNRTLWEDTQMNLFSYAHPTKEYGSFGIQVFALASSDYIRRDTIFDDESRNFNIGLTATNFSYSRSLYGNYHAGLNLKILNKRVDNYSGTGMGIDMGGIYDFNFAGKGFYIENLNKMRAGLTLKNIISPSVQMSGEDEDGQDQTFEKERFSPGFALGLAYFQNNIFTGIKDKLTVGLDMEQSPDMDPLFSLGYEYAYREMLFLRMGLLRHFSMGFGVKYRSFQFDFGFDTHELGTRGQFSLTGRFGVPVRESDEYSSWRAKKEAAEYYKKGLEYRREGNLSGALSEFEKALIWAPDNEDIQKSLEEASRELEASVTRKLVERHIGQGYATYEEGDLVESLEAWGQVAKLDPSNIRAHEYIERIQERLTEREKDVYKERLREKERAEIISYLGEADSRYSRGEYKGAIEKWEEVLKLDPGHGIAGENIKEARLKLAAIIEGHIAEGKELFEEEKYGLSRVEFGKALGLDPDNKTAAGYIEKIDEAVAETKVLASPEELDRIYYEAADLYLKGRYPEARETAQKLISLDPSNKNAFKLLEKIESVLSVMGKRE